MESSGNALVGMPRGVNLPAENKKFHFLSTRVLKEAVNKAKDTEHLFMKSKSLQLFNEASLSAKEKFKTNLG